jgi:hypothetical protein
MASWQEMLLNLMSPRQASAEVAAHDDPTDELFMRTLTGPRTLPQYVQTLQMALDRPESVDVATMRSIPGGVPGRYYHATSTTPGLVALALKALPNESKRRAMAARYQPTPGNPYDIGYGSPELFGRPEQVMTHELGHFLAQMYGLNLPQEMEERVVQHQASQPIDYPLLRAAWQARQGQEMTPYWEAVRRQMEGPAR